MYDMRCFHGVALPAAILACSIVSASATTLMVGPGQKYAIPSQAFKAAKDGDTILIDAAGDYAGDRSYIRANNLTIQGINGRPHLTPPANGWALDGKGLWNVDGQNTTIDNIEISGVRQPGNGAAIRFEGRNLTIRNCYFHDNNDGILTNETNIGNILIEYSEFDHNGAGDGQSHNMYINHADSFTLRFCYSHDAHQGHLVKSRANVNYILYNRLSDEDGDTSYEIDLPVGGTSYVVGNVIEQGPKSPNYNIISYGEESIYSWGTLNPGTDLYVVNNTIVNDESQGTFITVSPNVTTTPLIQNNVFYGPGGISAAASAQIGNFNTKDSSTFVDRANYDYHLTAKAGAIGHGAPLSQILSPGFSPAPLLEYIHSPCSTSIDSGAFQYNGSSGPILGPDTCGNYDPAFTVANGANYGPQVAFGSIASILGPNLETHEWQASTLPLPTSTPDGISVTVNGTPAALFHANSNEISFQVPYSTTPGMALAVVWNGKTAVGAEVLPVHQSAPGLFLHSNSTQAMVQNRDNSSNDKDHPAKSGDIITAYLTGQGPLSKGVKDGEETLDALATAQLPASATIGGKAAAIQFLGLSPHSVDLLQANIQVPSGLSAGAQPLIVTIGGVASNAGMIYAGN